MRGLLSVVAVLTIAASGWLGLMFLTLHRPGFEQGAAMAALFVLQSLLVLALSNDWLRGGAWWLLASVGALGLIWAGARAIIVNVHSPHFEGYAIVIGFLLTLQGALTLLASSSKVHQFGN